MKHSSSRNNVESTGLLAGLYEFPSSENVDENELNLLEVSHSILDDLLASPPPKYNSSDKQRTISGNTDSELRITDIRHVGDTLHIFSHIRKTYRICSVVLQGGSYPPLFSADSGHQSKRRKTHDVATDDGVYMRWVPEESVADAK